MEDFSFFLFYSEQEMVYICIVYVRIVTQPFVIYAYRLECMVPQTPSASFTSAVRVKFRISSNNTNDQNRLDRLPREIMRTTVAQVVLIKFNRPRNRFWRDIIILWHSVFIIIMTKTNIYNVTCTRVKEECLYRRTL